MNETTIMKTGETVRMAEATAMRLVAEKTNIPVPKVLDAYTQEADGRGVILMEYVEGETLDKPWTAYNAAQQASIILQLQSYLQELRTLPGLGNGVRISAIDGSSCCDQFFDAEGADSGPFDNEVSAAHTRRRFLVRDGLTLSHLFNWLSKHLHARRSCASEYSSARQQDSGNLRLGALWFLPGLLGICEVLSLEWLEFSMDHRENTRSDFDTETTGTRIFATCTRHHLFMTEI